MNLLYSNRKRINFNLHTSYIYSKKCNSKNFQFQSHISKKRLHLKGRGEGGERDRKKLDEFYNNTLYCKSFLPAVS